MKKPGIGNVAATVGIASVYFLMAFEIVFMILPFAVFFYSVYAPILNALASNPVTGWTTEFFLPHMVFTRDPLILGISYLQVTFILGLALFLGAAIPLYYTKIFKKNVACKGPYARIRHPQYLSLGIAGFGLMLYWPRFIILIFYISMLFVIRNSSFRARM